MKIIGLNTISAFSFVVFLLVQPLMAQDGTERSIDDPASREKREFLMTVNPLTGQIPPNIRERELQFSASIPTVEQLNRGALSKQSAIATQTWKPRGPFNVGGRTRALGIDVANPDNILAGGVSGGMWRSIDGGQSWTIVSDMNGHLTTSCIAQDMRPGKTATWYYGTGEYSLSYQARTFGDGVYKSTDNGASWQQLVSTTSGLDIDFSNWSYIYKIVVDNTNSEQDIVYVAAAGGIFRSTDGGVTWVLVLGKSSLDDEPIARTTDIEMGPDGQLYASFSSRTLHPGFGWQSTGDDTSSAGVYRSVNGTDWTKISTSEFPALTNRVVAGVSPSTPNTVYILTSNSNEGFETPGIGSSDYSGLFKYTYLSGDGSGGGGTWEDLSSNLPDFGNYGRFNTQSGYNLVVEVAPDNPNTVYLGATSLYRSTDGFSSNANTSWIGGYNHDFDLDDPMFDWLNINYPNHHPDVHAILFHPEDQSIMYTGTDGGVQKTLDCQSDTVVWSSLNSGITTTQFYSVAIDQGTAGDERILGGFQDNGSYVSIGGTNNWRMVASGDGFGCEIPPASSNMYYCSMYSGNLTKTITDDDVNVISVERIAGEELINLRFDFFTEWMLDPNDPNVGYLAGQDYLHRNPDLSAPDVMNNWEIMPPTGAKKGARGPISCITPTYTDTTGLYFGTQRGYVFRMDNMLTTSGLPVELDSAGLPFRGYISCISVDKEQPENVLVVVANYGIPSLYHSTDAGATWVDVSGNLEENPDGSGAGPSCRWAETVTKNGTTHYLVGTSTGLYSTTKLDGAATVWVKEGASVIGSAIVSCMRSRNSDGFVAIGTYGSGTFASYITTLSAETPESVPQSLYLEQNYPNPVSGKTSVRFHVPAGGTVTLALYDVLGNQVRTLYRGAPGAGIHEQTLTIDGMTPGNYFLRLSGANSASTRMITVSR